MNRAKQIAGTCLVLTLTLLFWGCSNRNDNAPKFDPVSGAHPANWLQTHWAEFAKKPDQCRTCHGSTTDPAAAGGVSGVSCFSCHPTGPGHPSGWADPSQHGRLGAQLAPNPDDPKAMAGFARCAQCHGADYVSGPATSCKSCHTKAPHPDAPWHGTTATNTNHDVTDQGNAPECFKCHANGANSTLVPATPAPVGTTPGCFNNTMCHGRTF